MILQGEKLCIRYSWIKLIMIPTKESSSQRDSYAFPFFGNISVPLMATLYIPMLNVGLSVWLGTIPNVPNALDASRLRNLCDGNHLDVPSSTKFSPPPSPTSGESIVTSNWKSK
jgi:hypothetical protein